MPSNRDHPSQRLISDSTLKAKDLRNLSEIGPE